jgi:hypothetical protein
VDLYRECPIAGGFREAVILEAAAAVLSLRFMAQLEPIEDRPYPHSGDVLIALKRGQFGAPATLASARFMTI